LGVACYHITRYGPVAESARGAIPAPLQGLCDRAWVGVQVFFVISGFVIAYSVRRARITPGYFANFALRRSLRLDPPYWTTLALVLLLHFVMTRWWGSVSPLDVPTPLNPPLSPRLVGAHLLYLHQILGYDSLSTGFWTLCIEFQFYLAYVLGLGLVQWLSRQTPRLPGWFWPVLTFGGLAIASLGWWNLERRYENFVPYFFCLFFVGIAAFWSVTNQAPRWVFWVYAGLVLARLGATDALHFDRLGASLELKAALACGISIVVLHRAGRLATALDWPWLQFLGRVSYSLYLIHFAVAHLVTTLAERVLGAPLAPRMAAVTLLVALLASLVAAQVLYRVVEAPSVRLANRFRRPSES
jgi:peptidoglycan/LPS O-acetylase OafA/YrhL